MDIYIKRPNIIMDKQNDREVGEIWYDGSVITDAGMPDDDRIQIVEQLVKDVPLVANFYRQEDGKVCMRGEKNEKNYK